MAKFPTKPVAAVGAATVLVLGATGLSVARSGSDTGPQQVAAQGSAPYGMAGGDRHGPRGGGPGGGPGGVGRGAHLSTLAEQLGVEADDLREALQEVREEQRDANGSKGDRREQRLDELADALDADADEIEEALQSLRGTRGDRPQGTTPSGGPKGGHGPRGGGFGLGRGAASDELIKALADATGKPQAQVKAALERLAEAHQDEHEAREAAFIKALAEKLGLSESKVESAIEAARAQTPSKSGSRAPYGQTTP